MKPPAPGSLITIVIKSQTFAPLFCSATVKKICGKEIRCEYVSEIYRRGDIELVLAREKRRKHEGRTWARGIEGVDVDALHAAEALR